MPQPPLLRHEIHLFAVLREAHGSDTLVVELVPGATAADLLPAAAAASPALAPHLDGVRVAAALRFVQGDHVLAPDEALALIPPVSGG